MKRVELFYVINRRKKISGSIVKSLKYDKILRIFLQSSETISSKKRIIDRSC